MSAPRLPGLARLIRSGSVRARGRAAARADRLAVALAEDPAVTRATVSPSAAGAMVTVEAPGLAAREFGTADTVAAPLLAPALDRLARRFPET
ncbi:hypothetical protein [uncultured Methylobacterium sp.]|uniref:hypothetical protein n=1 Tax=uncultured Methylobacterium sp. TaxID=157278 RepID=UPI0026310135|nr:hypothetical protein [uncultured Methylobacterium sp.]